MPLIDHSSPFLTSLDYDNLDSSEQVRIDALIEVASELIEKECNRIFAVDDYTDERVDGDDLNCIFVKNLPINSLTSINIIPSYQVDELSFDAALFDYNSKSGHIWWKKISQLDSDVDVTNYIGYFPKGEQNIKVTYNGGFSDIPTPIKMLCADLVLASYSPEDMVGNLDSEKLGQYYYKSKKDVLDNVLMTNKRIISLYKIRRV